jgi:multiple sugar transport system ATP-binding protein
VQAELTQLEKELDMEALRPQLIVALDSASRIQSGDEAEIYVDARKMHLFAPESQENLTVGT